MLLYSMNDEIGCDVFALTFCKIIKNKTNCRVDAIQITKLVFEFLLIKYVVLLYIESIEKSKKKCTHYFTYS